MGRRQGRVRERDEQISGAGGGVTMRSGPAGKNLSDHVLSLQRDYGNTAVTGVVVQRTPRKSMAASQDIKDTYGYKAPKKGAKAAKPAPKPKGPETFWPKLDPVRYPQTHEEEWKIVTNEYLLSEGQKWVNGKDKNAIPKGIELLEELFARTKNKALVLPIWRAYKAVGDAKRAAFWLAVMNGDIKVP